MSLKKYFRQLVKFCEADDVDSAREFILQSLPDLFAAPYEPSEEFGTLCVRLARSLGDKQQNSKLSRAEEALYKAADNTHFCYPLVSLFADFLGEAADKFDAEFLAEVYIQMSKSDFPIDMQFSLGQEIIQQLNFKPSGLTQSSAEYFRYSTFIRSVVEKCEKAQVYSALHYSEDFLCEFSWSHFEGFSSSDIAKEIVGQMKRFPISSLAVELDYSVVGLMKDCKDDLLELGIDFFTKTNFQDRKKALGLQRFEDAELVTDGKLHRLRAFFHEAFESMSINELRRRLPKSKVEDLLTRIRQSYDDSANSSEIHKLRRLTLPELTKKFKINLREQSIGLQGQTTVEADLLKISQAMLVQVIETALATDDKDLQKKLLQQVLTALNSRKDAAKILRRKGSYSEPILRLLVSRVPDSQFTELLQLLKENDLLQLSDLQMLACNLTQDDSSKKLKELFSAYKLNFSFLKNAEKDFFALSYLKSSDKTKNALLDAGFRPRHLRETFYSVVSECLPLECTDDAPEVLSSKSIDNYTLINSILHIQTNLGKISFHTDDDSPLRRKNLYTLANHPEIVESSVSANVISLVFADLNSKSWRREGFFFPQFCSACQLAQQLSKTTDDLEEASELILLQFLNSCSEDHELGPENPEYQEFLNFFRGKHLTWNPELLSCLLEKEESMFLRLTTDLFPILGTDLRGLTTLSSTHFNWSRDKLLHLIENTEFASEDFKYLSSSLAVGSLSKILLKHPSLASEARQLQQGLNKLKKDETDYIVKETRRSSPEEVRKLLLPKAAKVMRL